MCSVHVCNECVFEVFCLHTTACVFSLSSQCIQDVTHTYAQHMQGIVIVILKEFVLYGFITHTFSQYVLQVLT